MIRRFPGGAETMSMPSGCGRRGRPIRFSSTCSTADHVGALMDRVRAESISKVLYPSDATPAGEELRLRQEYFFASASLQDLVRRHLSQHGAID